MTKEDQRKITINADWSLEEDKRPEFITRSGLHFIFENIKNRGKKQALCLELSTDLTLILETLKEIHQKGMIIDWETLRLEPVTGESKFKLIINKYGDAILFKFKKLTTLDELPEKIIKWFSIRAQDRKYHLYIDADELFAPYME